MLHDITDPFATPEVTIVLYDMKISITIEFELNSTKSQDLLLKLSVLGKMKLERKLYCKLNTMHQKHQFSITLISEIVRKTLATH